MSLQHFRKLYEIAKTDGLTGALKYDAIETVKRHPKVLMYTISAGVMIGAYLAKPKIEEKEPVIREVLRPDIESIPPPEKTYYPNY